MSDNSSIPDRGEAGCESQSELPRSAGVSSLQRCSAARIAGIVAEVDRDLRATSAKTNETIQRSLASVSDNMEIIARSREAIALSRDLLDRELILVPKT